MSGNTALIRANRTVYVYQRDEQGQWLEQSKLAAHGWSIALQGDTALVGDIIGENAEGRRTGTVAVSVRNNEGTWSQPVKLEPSGFDGNFGYSMALEGNTVLVGGFPFHARAYIYNLSDIITP